MRMDERFELIELSAQWVSRSNASNRRASARPGAAPGFKGISSAPAPTGTAPPNAGQDGSPPFLGAHVIGDEAEIVNLATYPAYRRLGLAAALIEALFFSHPGLKQVFLEVRASNAAAQALYEKMGFSRYAVRRNYYEKPDEDAILMRYQAIRREPC